MNKGKQMGRTIWGACTAAGLAIGYWLCRYALFDLHGMKQWPNMLAIVGLVVLLIASAAGFRFLALAAALGYPLAFGIAMMTFTQGVDQGGGGTNNAWIIWGGVYLLCKAIGIAADIITRRTTKAGR